MLQEGAADIKNTIYRVIMHLHGEEEYLEREMP
jgi:hypothetical protein